MNLKPEELEENGYLLLDEMNHKDIVPFVKKFLHKRTWFSLSYYFCFLISLLFLLSLCIQFYRGGILTMGNIFLQIFYGLLFVLALIPLHEWLHALAYQFTGAKRTSFDMNLKRFYFLAIADRFVANKREFQIVALCPFVTITLALVIATCLAGESWKVSLLTTLTIHSMACSGDFALLSYFEFNRKKNIVTYDDKENKVSFFYGKEK